MAIEKSAFTVLLAANQFQCEVNKILFGIRGIKTAMLQKEFWFVE